MQPDIKDLAKAAYNAYGKSMDWKENSGGDIMPEWKNLSVEIQMAWICSVYTVQQLVLNAPYLDSAIVGRISDIHPNELHELIKKTATAQRGSPIISVEENPWIKIDPKGTTAMPNLENWPANCYAGWSSSFITQEQIDKAKNDHTADWHDHYAGIDPSDSPE